MPKPVAAEVPLETVERVDISPDTRSRCSSICERSKQLKCKNGAACLANCLAMGSLTPCSNEIGALYACLVTQPQNHWECDDEGVAAIRDGFCDAEQEKALGCMESKMQR